MAHEISINEAGKAEAAFAYTPAWHGLGALVDSLMTVDEALDAANLRWTVDKAPLYFADHTEVPDRVAVQRGDNGMYLGTVGKDWVPVQNEEQARFIEALTGEGASVVECVGAIREGRRTFWTIKVPGEIVLPGNDSIDKYLIVANGHDGSLAFRAFWSPIRVVCNNTVNAALSKSNDGGVSLFHRSKVIDHLDAARALLGLANKYYTDLGKRFERLLDRAFTDAEFRIYVDEVVPKSPGKEGYTALQAEARDSIARNYESGVGHELAGKTAWGAYNSVTEYVCHQREYTSASRRFENILLGGTKAVQQKAFDVALAMSE